MISKSASQSVRLPQGLQIRLMVCVLKAGTEPKAERTSQGLYAVSFDQEELLEGQFSPTCPKWDTMAWESPVGWPVRMEFETPPSQLGPHLPGTLFRFKIHYEWTLADGTRRSFDEFRNTAATGPIDYLQRPPSYVLRLLPRDSNEGPPIRLDIGK
jgi:hypothetical protein